MLNIELVSITLSPDNIVYYFRRTLMDLANRKLNFNLIHTHKNQFLHPLFHFSFSVHNNSINNNNNSKPLSNLRAGPGQVEGASHKSPPSVSPGAVSAWPALALLLTCSNTIQQRETPSAAATTTTKMDSRNLLSKSGSTFAPGALDRFTIYVFTRFLFLHPLWSPPTYAPMCLTQSCFSWTPRFPCHHHHHQSDLEKNSNGILWKISSTKLNLQKIKLSKFKTIIYQRD